MRDSDMIFEKGREFKEGRYIIVRNECSNERHSRVDLVFDVKNNAKRHMKTMFDIEFDSDKLDDIKRLSHPNIIKFYDSFFGSDSSQFHLIVEHAKGQYLNSIIKDYRSMNGKIERKTITKWSIDILQGCEFIHSSGIIHGNIRPENLYLDQLGLVRIDELGLSKYGHRISLSSPHMDKLTYMSSQLINHERFSEKTDIWSFGCILYELLTLRKAFNEETVKDISEAVLANEPEPIGPDEPQELVFILEKSLVTDDENRASAGELLNKLNRKFRLSPDSLSAFKRNDKVDSLEYLLLNNGNYELRTNLKGRNAVRLCYGAKEKERNINVIIKMVALKHMDKNDLNYYYREIDIVKKLNSDHVMKFRRYFQDRVCSIDYACIVSEYFQNGSLETVIRSHRVKSELIESQTIYQWCIQLFQGLGDLHSIGISHRDIKPRNIFLDHQNNIKLGDINLARCVEQAAKLQMNGMSSYVAPECYEGKKFSSITDMWSAGCLIYELEFLQPIDLNSEEYEQRCVDSRFGKLWRRLVVVDAQKRTTASDLTRYIKIKKLNGILDDEDDLKMITQLPD